MVFYTSLHFTLYIVSASKVFTKISWKGWWCYCFTYLTFMQENYVLLLLGQNSIYSLDAKWQNNSYESIDITPSVSISLPLIMTCLSLSISSSFSSVPLSLSFFFICSAHLNPYSGLGSGQASVWALKDLNKPSEHTVKTLSLVVVPISKLTSWWIEHSVYAPCVKTSLWLQILNLSIELQAYDAET